MGNLAIRVENLAKMYHIGGPQERYKTLRDGISDMVSAPFRRIHDLIRGQAYGASDLKEEIWALKDVSFEIKHGEVVGIIGRNGSGKSTLLKILSRITEPTSGYAEVYGRVGALLEVGTGFHPELTGRENIYLNGAILGMTRKEINQKFDEIVAFAGVEKFVDTPVKHYSSGMGLRLGFAVAAYLEPEILVVDEVLAVGDADFQRKCLGKMENVAASGRTVLFVSHNMEAIESLCTRVIWLNEGNVGQIGDVAEIINSYLGSSKTANVISLRDRKDRTGQAQLRFVDVRFVDELTGNEVVQTGKTVDIILEYEAIAKSTLENVHISIMFSDSFDRVVFSCSTNHQSPYRSLPQRGKIICRIERFPLLPGRYNILLTSAVNGIQADRIENAVYCDVHPGDFFGTGKLPEKPSKYGAVLVKHEWLDVRAL